jgi:hypothetical protein
MLARIMFHRRQPILFHRTHRTQPAKGLPSTPDWLDGTNGTDVFLGDNHVN